MSYRIIDPHSDKGLPAATPTGTYGYVRVALLAAALCTTSSTTTAVLSIVSSFRRAVSSPDLVQRELCTWALWTAASCDWNGHGDLTPVLDPLILVRPARGTAILPPLIRQFCARTRSVPGRWRIAWICALTCAE